MPSGGCISQALGEVRQPPPRSPSGEPCAPDRVMGTGLPRDRDHGIRFKAPAAVLCVSLPPHSAPFPACSALFLPGCDPRALEFSSPANRSPPGGPGAALGSGEHPAPAPARPPETLAVGRARRQAVGRGS